MQTQILQLSQNKEYNDVVDIWKSYPNDGMAACYENPVFAGSAFLNLLNISSCVTWILDIRTQRFNFVSTNTIEYFGYESINYLTNGHHFHETIIHPDDRKYTWKLLYHIWNALAAIPLPSRSSYKFSYDYRIVKPDGKVARILEQNSVLQLDGKGNITHLLGVCSDITHWKRNGVSLASLSSAIDKQHFLFSPENNTPMPPKAILSKRELEILKLISEGQSSKYIADKLFISFHTVNTHRQKMIGKTNTKNTSGLVQFAVCNGLI